MPTIIMLRDSLIITILYFKITINASATPWIRRHPHILSLVFLIGWAPPACSSHQPSAQDSHHPPAWDPSPVRSEREAFAGRRPEGDKRRRHPPRGSKRRPGSSRGTDGTRSQSTRDSGQRQNTSLRQRAASTWRPRKTPTSTSNSQSDSTCKSRQPITNSDRNPEGRRRAAPAKEEQRPGGRGFG